MAKKIAEVQATALLGQFVNVLETVAHVETSPGYPEGTVERRYTQRIVHNPLVEDPLNAKVRFDVAGNPEEMDLEIGRRHISVRKHEGSAIVSSTNPFGGDIRPDHKVIPDAQRVLRQLNREVSARRFLRALPHD